MQRHLYTLILGTTLCACTSMNTNESTPRSEPPARSRTERRSEYLFESVPESRPETQQPNEQVRLAEAQVTGSGDYVKGTFKFEQMPNSVIVTYSLEGLTPKREYQIYVKDPAGCSSGTLNSVQALKDFKANKQGGSENTFKAEDFTVSGRQSLLGRSIVVTVKPTRGASSATPLACGDIVPTPAQTTY